MSSSQRDTTYYYVRPTDSLFVRGVHYVADKVHDLAG